MEVPNWAAEQQWWQQQWGGQQQQHQQQPGWGAHAGGAPGGPHVAQHAGQAYAGYAAPANNMANQRQALLGDQRALFMQAAQPGQRLSGGGGGGSLPGGGQAGAQEGAGGRQRGAAGSGGRLSGWLPSCQELNPAIQASAPVEALRGVIAGRLTGGAASRRKAWAAPA